MRLVWSWCIKINDLPFFINDKISWNSLKSVFAMAGYSSSVTLIPKLINVLLLKIHFVIYIFMLTRTVAD